MQQELEAIFLKVNSDRDRDIIRLIMHEEKVFNKKTFLIEKLT